MSKRREERRGEERGSRDELPARVPRSETEIEALDRSTDAMDVDEEVKKLVDEMKRLGSADETGTLKVKFGVLFRDDRCQQIFEALIGARPRACDERVTHTHTYTHTNASIQAMVAPTRTITSSLSRW